MTDRISPRDLRLMVLLARGHTTDRAARELCLSRHTVGEEISSLLDRFNCRNRAELVAYCYAHRLLPIGIWPPSFQKGDCHERPPGSAA
ncbi:response regulator transcription factor [Actinoplanes sp. NPDC020271]|uniref:response regulator transcription factor n=1 Tax=Actinoplanes sp. NPDC020271 TaxID=3363896 RepID=UPI00379BBF8F